MTFKELIQRFLHFVNVIKGLNPAYEQPGDGSNGVCDCIGLIIGALKRMGIKWPGIHGSNYGARYQTTGLSYISNVSDLELGDMVFKACEKDGTLKLACNAGTKTHKWDLPNRYFQGKPYYNGDMKDYYHVGTVTQVNPLRITHMTSPHMKVDTNLNGGWNYHGKIKLLVSEASNKTEVQNETIKPIPEPSIPIPESGSKAVVVADNGAPVKLRMYPSTSCRTWVKVKCGERVTITEPGEKWAKVDWGKYKGWYMMAEFLDVIGDGKGKY